jgi:hypothetical protein
MYSLNCNGTGRTTAIDSYLPLRISTQFLASDQSSNIRLVLSCNIIPLLRGQYAPARSNYIAHCIEARRHLLRSLLLRPSSNLGALISPYGMTADVSDWAVIILSIKTAGPACFCVAEDGHA